MELWVFDRSGPYSSGEFDIHKEPFYGSPLGVHGIILGPGLKGDPNKAN